ncbi:MAG: nucleotidyltransferase domain-containing protein, partial [Ferruginibacter sp.]|nr:nucleotidyltransferase domain-containing protein [Cytophagales bacterium]
MEATITQQLWQLAAERNVTVLYACESGSRAWGFPSPDSDYDVRLVYAHSK